MKKSIPLFIVATFGLAGCSVADQAPDTNDDNAEAPVTIMTYGGRDFGIDNYSADTLSPA